MHEGNQFWKMPRVLLGAAAALCGAVLLVGWGLQIWVGLVPCPLCIIQRFFFGLVGATTLIAVLHKRWQQLWAALAFVWALLGSLVALRNVVIQLTPEGLGEQCLPALESLLDYIRVVFEATGDCAKRDWTLLGLSVPEWSLMVFVGLLLVTGYTYWILRKKSLEKNGEAKIH